MSGRRVLNIMTLILLIIAVMCLSGVNVMAEGEPQFLLEMKNLDFSINETTTMTVSMINAEGATIKELVGMDWAYVPFNETTKSNELIDGTMASVERANYSVYPYYGGRYVIWATIEYEGKTYMTNKLELNIKDNSIDTSQYKKTFLKTVVSNKEIYVGQKTVLAYELYSIYKLDNYFFLNDFLVNDLLFADAPTAGTKIEKITQDGLEFTKTDVKTYFLTPIKPGLYVIPGNGFYAFISEDEFVYENNIRLLSEPHELIVKPLPTENQPSDFSWIIGDLKLDAQYNTSEVTDNNSLTLTVRASGNCSLDSLKKIFKEDPPGFTVYENEVKYSESYLNNEYHAEKTFEISLIPKQSGQISIDPVYISYFDTVSATYKRAEIPGVTVTVDENAGIIKEGDEQADEGQPGQNQQTGGNTNQPLDTVIIEQINYASDGEGIWVIRVNKIIVLSVMAVLVIAGAVIFILVKRPKMRHDQLDGIYAQLIKSNDNNEVYNNFSLMIRHCFGLSPKVSSRSEIAEAIGDKDLADPILEVMDYVENGRLAAGSADKKLISMIKNIYKKLKKK